MVESSHGRDRERPARLEHERGTGAEAGHRHLVGLRRRAGAAYDARGPLRRRSRDEREWVETRSRLFALETREQFPDIRFAAAAGVVHVRDVDESALDQAVAESAREPHEIRVLQMHRKTMHPRLIGRVRHERLRTRSGQAQPKRFGFLQRDLGQKLIAHPECEEPILRIADFIGSTTGLLKYSQKDDAQEYIVATEAGILHQMELASPQKTFIPAPPNNSCACNDCPHMKLNTLEKLYLCLKYEKPELIMDETLMKEARKPIDRMLEISAKYGL